MSTTTEKLATFRPATADDSKALGQICYDAFATLNAKHNFPPDFPSPEVAQGLMDMMATMPFVYSVVAEIDGRPVASNFLWETGEVAGVGPITVDPNLQNSGIGRRLMDDVLRRAEGQGFRSVRLLQAAFHGRSMALYAKLGFDIKEPIACINGTPLDRQTPGYEVRSARMDDLPTCNALCLAIHGHNRSIELKGAIAQGTANVAEKGGRIVGYSTDIGFLGHTVGEDNEAVQALIAAAKQINGPGLLLPTRNTELFRWTLSQGLRFVQPLTLMSKGWYQEPNGAWLCSILY